MELWIRSQDKKVLIICSKLYVGGTYGNEIIEEDMCSLGKYRSKERALEVLDEIDEFIDLFQRNGFENVLSDDGVHPKHTIYKMPEK